MRKDEKICIVLYISLVVILGIIPLFLPPNISDLSYINWNGQDLSEDIYEDTDYLNKTFTFFNQTDHLYFYSVKGRSYSEKVAMITLQGLVNKYNTSLFVEETDYDSFWYKKLQEYYGISTTNLSATGYWNVISQFKDRIKGLVIYDEDLIDTVNVATFLASLKECVVITNDMKDEFEAIGITEVKHDLRNKFSDNVEAYEWAWEKYKDKASKKGLFNLDTSKVIARDYVIASQYFAMWLTPGPFGPKREIELFRKILDESPKNIPVWGWFKEGSSGEYEGIRTVSHAGKYQVVSTWSNPTVYSSFHIPQFQQKEVDFEISDFSIKNKIYLTIIVSDGDNLRYCHDTLRELWDDKSRGDFPVGFTISPLLYKLNPAVIKYYYESATENEYFICPPSGAGYCYPDMNPAITDFLSHTKPILDWCDMDQIWLLNGYEAFEPKFSDEILNAYTSKEMGLSAVYLNYHDFQVENNKLINNIPVFYSIFVEEGNEIIGKLKSIELCKPHKNQPIFVYIATNSWNVQFLEMSDTIEQLDSSVYEVLRPDHFSEVFKKYQQEKENTLFDEFSIFIIAGLIPLLTALSILALIWIKRYKNERYEIVDSNLNEPKNPGFNDINKAKFPKILVNFLYLFADITFLFAIKYCLFASNLIIVYFALLIISVFLGIFLKKVISKSIGVKMTFLISGLLMGLGFLLFAIDYRFVMFFGVPLGIILTQQFQTQGEMFETKSLKNRAFIYWFILSLVILNLFPRESYILLTWVLVIGMLALSIINFIYILKFNKNNNYNSIFEGEFKEKAKVQQYKSFLLGYLFVFLFFLTFIQERFYYHLIWGLNWYPSKLSIQYSIATVLILAIGLFEFFELKNIKVNRKNRLLLFLIGVSCYLIIPLLLQGIIIFYLVHFIFIFGILLLIDIIFLDLPKFRENNQQLAPKNERDIQNSVKGYNLFTFGVFFWFLFLTVLMFIPPVAIVVDTYNMFEKAGIMGIIDLEWSPFFWTLFYIPSIYLFIALPVTIFCLIYGAIFTISNALNPSE